MSYMAFYLFATTHYERANRLADARDIVAVEDVAEIIDPANKSLRQMTRTHFLQKHPYEPCLWGGFKPVFRKFMKHYGWWLLTVYVGAMFALGLIRIAIIVAVIAVVFLMLILKIMNEFVRASWVKRRRTLVGETVQAVEPEPAIAVDVKHALEHVYDVPSPLLRNDDGAHCFASLTFFEQQRTVAEFLVILNRLNPTRHSVIECLSNRLKRIHIAEMSTVSEVIEYLDRS
ncbi:hypothetical protein HED60_05470 [Planctomycetales bacterium ZRK34]|nr:hypothetical protein HED60_05470 [Planctomycetales bacterium ZRK34]